MGYMNIYGNVLILAICFTCSSDAHGGGEITDTVKGILVPEVETTNGVSRKSEEIIKTETGRTDIVLLDPQGVELTAGRSGNTNSASLRNKIEGIQISKRKRNRFKWKKNKNKPLKVIKKKKRLEQRKQKRQKNKKKRQKLKQLRKQKLKLTKTAKSAVNVNVSSKPTRWKNRRLKILQRMRARKAKVDMRKKQDALRKANKQRQRKIMQRKNLLLKVENTVTDARKNDALTKEAISMPSDIPVNIDIDSKTLSENAAVNIIVNDKQTNRTNVSVAHKDVEIPTGATNENNGKSDIKSNKDGIGFQDNLGVMLPVVPGFTLNDEPTIDLTGVMDPRTQLRALGMEGGFTDPLNSVKIRQGLPLGKANTGDSLLQQFNHSTGITKDQLIGENGNPIDNININSGTPLGPIRLGINTPFDPIHSRIDPNEHAGEIRIPLENINGGDATHTLGNTGSSSEIQLSPKEPFTNVAFDLNGNGIPISQVKTLTDIQDHSKANQKNIALPTNVIPVVNTSIESFNHSLNTFNDNLLSNTTDLTKNSNHSNSVPNQTAVNWFKSLDDISQLQSSHNETRNLTSTLVDTPGADPGPEENVTGEPLGTVDLNQQNNPAETGFNPLFSSSGEAAVFQSVDLNEFFSFGNRNDLDSNNKSTDRTQDKVNDDSMSGIMTLSGEFMPIAGQTSNLPNTASSKSKLPSSSLLGVLFEIQRSLRQGKGK